MKLSTVLNFIIFNVSEGARLLNLWVINHEDKILEVGDGIDQRALSILTFILTGFVFLIGFVAENHKEFFTTELWVGIWTRSKELVINSFIDLYLNMMDVGSKALKESEPTVPD